VFCGASPGARPAYAEAARALGQTLAARQITLVYGGASVGLMGVLADATLAAGGTAVGVIPRSIEEKELAHPRLSALHVVESMHERKQKMSDLADAFIALPGGYGTLEELAEVLTWAQLGLHRKPCGLLDVEGFFRPLLQYLDAAVSERFLRPQHREMLLVDDAIPRLLDRLATYQAPRVEKWIDRSST
jgi:uncharacterized protein (TIGR00730 family)